MIAFCTSAKGRLAHLQQTLPQNLRDCPDALFVLLAYGDPSVLEYAQAYHQADIDSGHLVVYSYATDGPFAMAHAKNLAARCAIREGATHLCNLDADNYTGFRFDRYIAETLTPGSLLWSRMVHRCNHPCPEPCLLPRDHAMEHSPSREFLEAHYAEDDRPLVRGISGRLAYTARDFMKVGGYDEARFPTWGPDDRDLNHRLQWIGLALKAIPNRYLDAIHHSEKVRFHEYPHARVATDSGENPLDRHDTAIVNFGRIGLATVTRNFDPTPIEIEPVPTRIFGIGWQKTASTSLHSALSILGYDAAHWTTPRHARDVWTEMTDCGSSLTMEKHDAATDFPIPLLYRELDRAYPGSKFILTVRDEMDWLNSVARHWSESNPWRASWDHDCFSHRMHTIAYGRRTFDPLVMLERYRRHNAEVRAYFADRPGDLLVMDTHRWDGLCAFLGKPVPSGPYPMINKSV